MKIFTVDNVEQAIELAQEFKDEGRFDLFRGQTHDWPPHSSLYRLVTNEEIETNRKTVYEFYGWLEQQEQLKYLCAREYDNHVQAIMQHYGIPTNYIDFSPNPAVAGFFSADGYKEEPGGNCCIYCLNSEEFVLAAKFVEAYHGERCLLRLVQVKVDNLWRLESQSGVFVVANNEWDYHYQMDRIVFPYTGYPSYPSKDKIYPLDKSPLEQLLDRFFFVSKMRTGGQSLLKVMTELEERGEMGILIDNTALICFNPAYFKDGFTEDPSWAEVDAAGWNHYPVEPFKGTVDERIALDVSGRTTNDQVRMAIYYGIKSALNGDATLRSRNIRWVMNGLTIAINEEKYNVGAAGIWNGMRSLPYSHEEIAEAIANLFLLIVSDVSAMGDEAQVQFVGKGAEVLELEFAHPDSSYSRAMVSETLLRYTFRSNLDEYYLPGAVICLSEVENILVNCNSPRFLFDFPKYKSLFARQIIPWQFARSRTLVLFDCYNLFPFGLA